MEIVQRVSQCCVWSEDMAKLMKPFFFKLSLIKIDQKRGQTSLYRAKFSLCIPLSLNLGTVVTQSAPVITLLKGSNTLCRYKGVSF
jgi:hypothetical protein